MREGRRPFRFGVIGEAITSRDALLAEARRAEALGYSTLLLRDHLVPEPFGDQLAPLVALTAAACATRTLRVGSLVLDNDYRHPVVLAKEAATLDLLSEGRFELGIGVVLALWGTLFGPFNALGWIAVGLNLFLGSGFAWSQLGVQAAAGRRHHRP